VAKQPRWQLVEEKGNHEDDPTVDNRRAIKDVLLAGNQSLPPSWMGDEEPSHMTNWLACCGSRKQPNATVTKRFSHSVACDGSALLWTGKRFIGIRKQSHPPTMRPRLRYLDRPGMIKAKFQDAVH